MATETVKQLCKLIRQSKSDSEKFAALLLLTKVCKEDELNSELKVLLLKYIGTNFPTRLLNSSCNCKENTALSYATVGVAIFSTFKNELTQTERNEIFPHVLEVLKLCINGHFDQFPTAVIILLSDICNLALFLSITLLDHTEDSCEKLFKLLAEGLIGKKSEVQEKCLQTILQLIQKCNGKGNMDNSTQSVMNLLIEEIVIDNTSHRFVLIRNLNSLLESTSNDLSTFSLNQKEKLLKIVKDVLSSKVLICQRQESLILAFHLLSTYGLTFFSNIETDNSFLRLIVRLSCIEIKMNVEESSDNLNKSLLIANCKFIEDSCAEILKFENETESYLTFEDIKIMQPALEDVAKIISAYIVENLEKNTNKDHDLFPILLRTLCSWLCVENHVYSDTGFDLISTVGLLLQHSAQNQSHEFLKYLLPVTMLYVEDAPSLKKLFDFNIITSFNEIFNLLQNKTELYRLEIEYIVQCLYGIQITKNNCDFEKDIVCELSKFLHDVENTLISLVSDTTVNFFIYLLYVLLCNMTCNFDDDIVTKIANHFLCFLQSSVNFKRNSTHPVNETHEDLILSQLTKASNHVLQIKPILKSIEQIVNLQ